MATSGHVPDDLDLALETELPPLPAVCHDGTHLVMIYLDVVSEGRARDFAPGWPSSAGGPPVGRRQLQGDV
jgi:hypothetical protein